MASIIKQISEINAVSGNENEMRDFISDKINDFSVDNMGNIIAVRRGEKKKIMVVTHMDECGFIVSGITEKGYIKFKPVGNIDINTAISKKVVVGDNKIKGVIGMKAIHLQTKEERENTVPAKKLFIDIGAKSKEAALKKVKIGDYITFDTEFFEQDEMLFGKALSRCGIYAVLNAMEENFDNEIYFAFTAQKEVGMRGAKILAKKFEPDVIIDVSTVAAEDMFGVKSCEKRISLGGGAVISAMDRFAIYDKALTEKCERLAKKLKIPYQKAVLKTELTDSGALQVGAGGAACINISVPCRYARTPVEMVSKKDIAAAELLLKVIIDNMNSLK